MSEPIEKNGLLVITEDESLRIYHTCKALEALSDIALSAANDGGGITRTITVTAEGVACLFSILKEQLEIKEININLIKGDIE